MRTFDPSPSRRYPTRVGRPHELHTSITLEMSMNSSVSMIPPCWSWEPLAERLPCVRWCFLAIAAPSTNTRLSRGSTRITRPVWPALLPVTTFTVSSLWMFTPGMSQHLRSQRDDLHEASLAKLPRHRPEDAGPARVLRVGRQDHDRVVVEPDVGAVGATALLGGANDDGLDDLALLDRAAGQRVLHRPDDDVPHVRVPAGAAAEHANHEDLLRPGVVRHLAARFLLDHYLALSTTSTTRQRLLLDIGRVSTTRTKSPTVASFCSSWAASLLARATVFLYRGCRTRRSIRTSTVLSILSDTTTPTRTFRRPRTRGSSAAIAGLPTSGAAGAPVVAGSTAASSAAEPSGVTCSLTAPPPADWSRPRTRPPLPRSRARARW